MFKPLYTLFCLFFVFALLFTACDKQYSGIEELDKKTVQDYLQKNNLNFQQYGNSDIYYQVITQGSGPAMDYTKQLPLFYTVKTLDGSYASIDTFNNRYANYFGYFKPDSLREVMMNSGLKQGGKIRVILPSRFAFGKNGKGSIPGNSSLDYTISVINPDQLDLYEDAVIQAYKQANNLSGFTKSNTGLHYKIVDAGTGVDAITTESVITVEYTGKFFNGTVFDKTATGSTATFPLSSLVQGWREGLPLIKKGGSIRLLIPSHLGYGLAGDERSIPPFSCLDFDIKVTNVAN